MNDEIPPIIEFISRYYRGGNMDTLSRRNFIKNCFIAGASISATPLVLTLGGCAGSAEAAIKRKNIILESIEKTKDLSSLPNFIVILTDDMGYGDLSCQGSQAIRTPRLDQLAREGVRMTDFYACAPVCSPSRAGLLSGRYPIRTGVNDALINDRNIMGLGSRFLGYTVYPGIPRDEILIPEMLKRRGYATGMVGKWHLGNREPYLPVDFGFESFYGPLWSNDIKPFNIYRNRDIVEKAPADQTKLTGNYTGEAVRFIRENRGRPFFLYLAHTYPHIPLNASEGFRDKSKGGRYGDTVEELDWSTGVIIDELKELGIDKNTLVIFTSDNGPWYQGSAGGLRGRKRFVFEGGFRVPMIARWPGKIPEGTINSEMCMNFDLFATLCGIAGIDVPGDRIIDGMNILPVLQGKTGSPHETLYFYWRDNLWAVRHKNWKYHRRHEVEDINVFPWPSNTSQGPYLFNLSTDPDESYCLRNKYPEMEKELSAMMERQDLAVAGNMRGWK